MRVRELGAERARRFRQRRREQLEAGLEAADPPREPVLSAAVAVARAASDSGVYGEALWALAARIASVIDQAADERLALRRLGPVLMKVLLELGAVPSARTPARRPRQTALEQLWAANRRRPGG